MLQEQREIFRKILSIGPLKYTLPEWLFVHQLVTPVHLAPRLFAYFFKQNLPLRENGILAFHLLSIVVATSAAGTHENQEHTLFLLALSARCFLPVDFPDDEAVQLFQTIA